MEVNLKSVSKSCTETILEQMNNAFFTIKNKNNYSIGFFCHIKYENRNISVAIINNYNIGEDNNNFLNISINNKPRTIEIENFRYTNKKNDISIIEIDENKNKNIYFLELDYGFHDENFEIYLKKEFIYMINYNKDVYQYHMD